MSEDTRKALAKLEEIALSAEMAEASPYGLEWDGAVLAKELREIASMLTAIPVALQAGPTLTLAEAARRARRIGDEAEARRERAVDNDPDSIPELASPVDERERALRESITQFCFVLQLNRTATITRGEVADRLRAALSAASGEKPPAEPCPTCDGTGIDADGKDHEADCPTCGRKG